MLDLESQIFSGQQFWPARIDYEEETPKESGGFERVPKDAIRHIVNRKK